MLKPLSITEISKYITQIFDMEEMLQGVKIYGEVSGCSYVRGNLYFSLKDENSILSCIMFGVSGNNIKDGDAIMATGSLKYYAKGGKLNFYVSSFAPYGQGILYQKFLILKEKLEKEGLFSSEHKKPIPKQIKKIGVVTSATGAVIQDIINVSTRRNPSINIDIYPARVQGTGAEYTIEEGLEYFSKSDVDVVVVARGGGSLEDLQPFNTEVVARAVFNCLKPVVSAVGHETDFTICDFVSSLRAPTPSAAAELLTIDVMTEFNKIKKDFSKLSILMSHLIDDKINFVDSRVNSVIDNYESKCFDLKKDLMLLSHKLNFNFAKPFLEKENNLKLSLTKLEGLNPASILLKGWASVEKDDERLTTVKNIKKNDKIKINLKDGSVDAIVDNIQLNKKER